MHDLEGIPDPTADEPLRVNRFAPVHRARAV
jgi:hypothetical protein